MSEHIIYCLTNKVNGKKYVGQTKNFSSRMSGHQKKTFCIALYNAIQKYGWENFDKEVLVETDKENVDEMERSLIKEHKSRIPNGYNIRHGGQANNAMHPSSVHKIKKAMPNRKPCSIKGVVYNGIRAAAAVIGENRQMISHRLKSKTFKDWVYVDDEGYYSEDTPKAVVVEDKNMTPGEPCVVDGVEYESNYAACKANGVGKPTGQYRFKSRHFPNWNNHKV